MRGLLCLLVSFYCCMCAAHTGDTVQLFRVSNNHFYSVPMMYRSLIKYYVDPNIAKITFEFRGRTYPVDTRPYITGALRQWSQATAGLQFPLNFIATAATAQDADLRFIAISSQADVPDWISGEADGYATARDQQHPTAQVSLIIPRIPASLEDTMEMIDSVESLDSLINIWFTHFFLHETGHILGFDHPEHDAVSDVQRGGLPNVYLRVQLDDIQAYQTPHIMTHTLAEYIGDRTDQLERPLNEADVVLSEVETAAFRYAMSAHAGACLPPEPLGPRRNLGSTTVRCSLGSPQFVSIWLLLN